MFKRLAVLFRPEQRLLLLFFAAAFGVLAFLFLARVANGHGSHAFDNEILLSMRAPGDPKTPVGPGWLREAFEDLTALGGWPFLTLMTALVTAFLAMKGHWRNAALLVAAVAGESFIVGRLKEFFGRERPEAVVHFVEATSYSFPSGHAASAAAVYLTLAAILTRETTRRSERIFFVLSAVMIVLLIGVSRVYLGVHYPSDVLAGWSFGAAWASLVLMAARFLERKGH